MRSMAFAAEAKLTFSAAADGTNLQMVCPEGSDMSLCTAAFTSMHLTTGSSGYFEVCLAYPYIDSLMTNYTMLGHLALGS